MSQVKRVLKSIGTALLILVLGSAVSGGIVHELLKLSETTFLILMVSVLLIAVLSFLSAMIYVHLEP